MGHATNGRTRTPQLAGVLAARAGAAALALVVASGALADPRSREPERWETGENVGSQVCIDCHTHEEMGARYVTTRHGRSGQANWEGAVGCEACHGPGQGHVITKGKQGRMLIFSELPNQEVNDICLSCHEMGAHAQWRTSGHDARNMSCLSCHQIHHEGPEPKGLLSGGTEVETCGNCHHLSKAAMFRSAHMPVREESMTCSSCHAPHGSPGPAMLNQFSVNENCYACHAEYRSPVLWEHLPVRESCTTCHDPHGSLHRGMLNSRVPRLCQQCHDNVGHPTLPLDSTRPDRFFPNNRMFNRGCMNCHPAVHGSNHPSGVNFQR